MTTEPAQTPLPSRGRFVRLFVAVSASLALLIAAGTAYGIVEYRAAGNGGGTIGLQTSGPGGAVGPCVHDVCNYLLLGSDSRADLSPEQQREFGTNADIGGSNRADTIMLVHTDPKLQKAIILSFPRDLYVNVPGMGMGKINCAFQGGVDGGGPERMAQTVHSLTGLTINHVPLRRPRRLPRGGRHPGRRDHVHLGRECQHAGLRRDAHVNRNDHDGLPPRGRAYRRPLHRPRREARMPDPGRRRRRSPTCAPDISAATARRRTSTGSPASSSSSAP